VEDKIAKVLHHHSKLSLSLQDFKPSAVLVPLFKKNSDYHLLFTLRNQEVRHHKGEISFPGGVCDPEDPHLLATALREAQEEMGILEKDVKILGEMDDLITPTYYRITPFVGKIPHPYPFEPNHKEIDAVLEIPLKHFQNEENMQLKKVTLFGEEYEIPYYKWENHTIWGATGRIVRQLVELIKKEL